GRGPDQADAPGTAGLHPVPDQLGGGPRLARPATAQEQEHPPVILRRPLAGPRPRVDGALAGGPVTGAARAVPVPAPPVGPLGDRASRLTQTPQLLPHRSPVRHRAATPAPPARPGNRPPSPPSSPPGSAGWPAAAP